MPAPLPNQARTAASDLRRSTGVQGRERLDRARRAVERGALNRGLAEAWEATRQAVLERDQHVLGAVAELVSGIEARLAPRRQENARQLVAYTRHCVEDLQAGWRRPSPLGRLFNLKAHEEVKRCPGCAERVLAAASVCRYCGHRFDSGGDSRRPEGSS